MSDVEEEQQSVITDEELADIRIPGDEDEDVKVVMNDANSAIAMINPVAWWKNQIPDQSVTIIKRPQAKQRSGQDGGGLYSKEGKQAEKDRYMYVTCNSPSADGKVTFNEVAIQSPLLRVEFADLILGDYRGLTKNKDRKYAQADIAKSKLSVGVTSRAWERDFCEEGKDPRALEFFEFLYNLNRWWVGRAHTMEWTDKVTDMQKALAEQMALDNEKKFEDQSAMLLSMLESGDIKKDAYNQRIKELEAKFKTTTGVPLDRAIQSVFESEMCDKRISMYRGFEMMKFERYTVREPYESEKKIIAAEGLACAMGIRPIPQDSKWRDFDPSTLTAEQRKQHQQYLEQADANVPPIFKYAWNVKGKIYNKPKYYRMAYMDSEGVIHPEAELPFSQCDLKSGDVATFTIRIEPYTDMTTTHHIGLRYIVEAIRVYRDGRTVRNDMGENNYTGGIFSGFNSSVVVPGAAQDLSAEHRNVTETIASATITEAAPDTGSASKSEKDINNVLLGASLPSRDKQDQRGAKRAHGESSFTMPAFKKQRV